jgi:8-oxo-dGTP pyrophosphatase MutT (NUDIX family)
VDLEEDLQEGVELRVSGKDMRDSTLVFLVKRNRKEIQEVCLAMKKRGFGAGRWNGVGGKVNEGESIEEGAVREAAEEISVKIKDLKKIACISFVFPHNSLLDQLVHVYFTENWEGEPQESEEMNPKWLNVSDIPYSEMWPDDIFWLPRVLRGELIKARFVFGEGDTIKDQEVEGVTNFE